MKSNSGFTLLEILIALLILAIIAGITTAGLQQILTVHERSSQATQQLKKLQITMVVMQRDIEQAINYPAQSAFIGNQNEITFTRTGYRNPLMAYARSTLERIRYSVNGNELIRAFSPLDGTDFQQQTLLKDLGSIQFQYLNDNKQYNSSWTHQKQLPLAISVTFDIKGWGKITRLFVIPSRGLPA